jgi:hypothetical protein
VHGVHAMYSVKYLGTAPKKFSTDLVEGGSAGFG